MDPYPSRRVSQGKREPGQTVELAGELAQVQVIFHRRNLHGLEQKSRCWRRRELVPEEGQHGNWGRKKGEAVRYWDAMENTRSKRL